MSVVSNFAFIILLIGCTKEVVRIPDTTINCPKFECQKCQDGKDQLAAYRDLYDMRSKQVEKCEDELTSLRVHYEKEKEDAEYWRGKYADIPSCPSSLYEE